MIRLNITQNAGLGSMITKVMSQLHRIPASESVHVYATSPLYAKGSENVWEWYFVNPELRDDATEWPETTYDEETMPFNTRLGDNVPLLKTHRRMVLRRVTQRFEIYNKSRSVILPQHRTLGIHYRGTDKSTEVPRVPYEVVLEQALALMPGHQATFLATDEQEAAEWFSARIPGLTINLHRRTNDRRGLHITTGDRQQANETMLDIYCLSLCDSLLLGRGNVADLALIFGSTDAIHYLREPS